MSEEAIKLLRSIDASLRALVQQRTADPSKPIAPDRDLDGKYGDPEIKVMPRDWQGPSYKGARMSRCPADLLDLVAEMFDYFGDQADRKNETTDSGKPVSQYKRADAARARGWAKRVREGRAPGAGDVTQPDAPASVGDSSGWAPGGEW